jgi:hypothetical protein
MGSSLSRQVVPKSRTSSSCSDMSKKRLGADKALTLELLVIITSLCSVNVDERRGCYAQGFCCVTLAYHCDSRWQTAMTILAVNS